MILAEDPPALHCVWPKTVPVIGKQGAHKTPQTLSPSCP